jgi:hypothetical protein
MAVRPVPMISHGVPLIPPHEWLMDWASPRCKVARVGCEEQAWWFRLRLPIHALGSGGCGWSPGAGDPSNAD